MEKETMQRVMNLLKEQAKYTNSLLGFFNSHDELMELAHKHNDFSLEICQDIMDICQIEEGAWRLNDGFVIATTIYLQWINQLVRSIESNNAVLVQDDTKEIGVDEADLQRFFDTLNVDDLPKDKLN